MAYRYSKTHCYVIPADKRTAVNNFLESQGFGPNFFNIELKRGDGPISHYGFSCVLSQAQLNKLEAVVKRANASEKKYEEDVKQGNRGALDKMLLAESLEEKKREELEAVSR